MPRLKLFSNVHFSFFFIFILFPSLPPAFFNIVLNWNVKNWQVKKLKSSGIMWWWVLLKSRQKKPLFSCLHSFHSGSLSSEPACNPESLTLLTLYVHPTCASSIQTTHATSLSTFLLFLLSLIENHSAQSLYIYKLLHLIIYFDDMS